MTPELAYFLKINVAIALFYAFYRLFFYKDTFFHWRRVALLCFFAISLLYPLLNIQGWIIAHYSLNIFSEILFYRLSLYISRLQMYSFGLNIHEISRF